MNNRSDDDTKNRENNDDTLPSEHEDVKGNEEGGVTEANINSNSSTKKTKNPTSTWGSGQCNPLFKDKNQDNHDPSVGSAVIASKKVGRGC